MPERVTIPTPLGILVAEAQHNVAYDGVTIFLCQDDMMVKIGAFVCPHSKDLLRAEIFSDLKGIEATTVDYIGRPQINALFDRWRNFNAMFK